MLQLTPQLHHEPPTWCLAGDLNVQHASEARTTMLAALQGWQGRTLRLDLSEVTEADTAGLQLLLALQRSLAEQGAALQVVHCPPPVAHVCQALGLCWHLNAEEVSP